MTFSLAMLAFLLLLLLKWSAFVGACVLIMTALIVAVLGREKRALNVSLAVTAGAALITALFYIPHLDYYIGYGIQTQVHRSNRIIESCMAISLVASVFLGSYRKWLSIGAVICVYVAFVTA